MHVMKVEVVWTEVHEQVASYSCWIYNFMWTSLARVCLIAVLESINKVSNIIP